ncbi:hypothetical protein IWQ55_002894 [Labrenzia sp. EL_208]|nr:hypothetical protein [Labrenzia sp. EL_132]MBG6229681.1 hypothetical protein [Labrenzia sp. EL_208]
MFSPERLLTVFVAGTLFSACSEGVVSPTQLELNACAKAILEYGGVGVKGDEYGYNVRSGSSSRSVQVNYPLTEKRPGFSCALEDGELIQIVRIEQIFPSSDQEL